MKFDLKDYSKKLADDFCKEESELKEKFGVDFDAEAMRFTLNKAEQQTINEWYKSLIPEILAAQNYYYCSMGLGEQTEPYYGAVGGGLTYSFTPTSLGDIITVTESTTKKTLNVSDALKWHFYG